MIWTNSTKPRLFWVMLLLGTLAACSNQPLRSPETATRASYWLCDGGDLMQLRQQEDDLWLQLPGTGTWHALNPARAASGALYINPLGVRFWNKGERARVETPEQLWEVCQLISEGTPDTLELPILGTDASPRALVLTAESQQPPWSLEMRQNGSGQISFEYGTQVYPFSETQILQQDLIQTRYQVRLEDGSLLEFQTHNQLCIEPQTGRALHHLVTFRFGQQDYRGCGQSY